MSVNEAVLSYLESYAPAKPSNISATTEKPIKTIYSALYQLKKAGKVKNLKGKGWTVVHRTPSKAVQEEKNTVRQYGANDIERLFDELNKAYDQVVEYKKKYERLHAIASYLEKRNGQLLAHVWETGGDIYSLGEK